MQGAGEREGLGLKRGGVVYIDASCGDADGDVDGERKRERGGGRKIVTTLLMASVAREMREFLFYCVVLLHCSTL